MRTKPSTINRSVRAQENLADASPLGCGAAFMHADRQHRKLLLAQPSSAPSAPIAACTVRPPEQLFPALEDIEPAIAADEASEDKKNAVAAKARGETRRSNRGALPAHLPLSARFWTILDGPYARARRRTMFGFPLSAEGELRRSLRFPVSTSMNSAIYVTIPK
jgi:hypothetical protein